jgi:peptidoglycan hydrolase CwlO-like protein
MPMTTSPTDQSADRFDRIEVLLLRFDDDLKALKEQVTRTNEQVTQTNEQLTRTNEQVTRTNDKVEIYQKASQQVVNLAFGLILTAALAIIIPAIVGR